MLDLLGLLNLQGNLFRNGGEKILKEISLENVEVEHDFSGGLSKRVTLKFSWQPPNFMTFFNPQDFRLGGVYAKLAMTASLNCNICDFERF